MQNSAVRTKATAKIAIATSANRTGAWPHRSIGAKSSPSTEATPPQNARNPVPLAPLAGLVSTSPAICHASSIARARPDAPRRPKHAQLHRYGDAAPATPRRIDTSPSDGAEALALSGVDRAGPGI